MKNLFTVFSSFLFVLQLIAQQPVSQLSAGGTPWSSKHADKDRDIVYLTMPSFDVQSLINEDELNKNNKNIPYRFGYNHLVNYNLNNSGSWINLEDGSRVWRLGIFSTGALSINLAFQYVSIPDGGKLFVFNADKSIVLGAFTQQYISSDLMLGTELINGDSIVVEYIEPANAIGQSSLELFRITHRYRGIDAFMEKTFGTSGSCMNNVNCPAYAPYDNQIRSVVCLVSGGSEFCTGALINNTCNDGTPYVLTANHCGASGFGSWVFRFNWEAAGCTNPGSSPSTAQSISGSTSRANSAGTDMRLVQINSAIPAAYGVYFAGWDRSTVPSVNPYCIHHPSGDIKKISFTTGTSSTATYSSAQCWKTPTWTDGVTEPGSSGSPLFNSSGLIIGQLYGGPSTCAYENNAANGYDFYGRVDISWTGGGTNSTRLSNWLAPASCGAEPSSLNGYDPNMPSIALDATIPSVTSPAATECDGNITPVVLLKNNGTTTLNTVSINYTVDAGSPVSFPWSGSLASNASVNVILPAFSTTTGAHTFTVSVSNPNGSPDQNTANDATTVSFNVVNPTGLTLPYTEGFENVTFPPSGWLNENPDNNTGSALWVRSTAASGFGNSTASARIDQSSPATSTAGQVDNLITPYLDLSASTNPTLSFSVANARYNASYYDSLIVWITSDCGGTWTRLASYGNNTGSSPLATAPDVTTAFIPTAAQWATKTLSLSSYATQTAVRVRFQLRSGWGNVTFLDDINVSSSLVGPPTSSFNTSSTTICEGQNINFTNTSVDATSVSWSFPGGSPGSSTQNNPSVIFNNPGTYTVVLTATNTNGTSTSSATITVNAAPNAQVSNVGTICQGSTATIAATGGSSFQWSTGASGNSITVSPSATTTYTVTVTGANGCTSTAMSTVNVVNCSSLNDLSNSDALMLYPNPVTNYFTLQLPVAYDNDLTVEILTPFGQSIQSNTWFANQTTMIVNTDNFASGLYLVRISDGKQSVLKRIVVVQ